MNSCNLEDLELRYLASMLQERGIIICFIEDPHRVVQDLTIILSVFYVAYDLSDSAHDCWKHRGFVKFLLETIWIMAQFDFE